MQTKKTKLQQLREGLLADMKTILDKHASDEMDLTDCGSTPVIWPSADDQDFDTYTLDRVYAHGVNILVDSSSSDNNRTDNAINLATDTLVEILEFLEDNDRFIWEKIEDATKETLLEEYRKPENNYPKTISFECTDPKGFAPDAKEWLRRVKAEVKITLLSKNVLRVEYPTDIVKQVRRVNIDDRIFRLDLIDPGDKFWTCHCIFPHIPWETKRVIFEHWLQCSCQSEDGVVIYTFPKI